MVVCAVLAVVVAGLMAGSALNNVTSLLTGQDFCSRDFKSLWTGFVDSFIDTLHARGPAVSAPCEPADAKPLPLLLPAVPRLIAIGDLHGDLDKAKRAFRLAGLIDANDKWVGGTTTAVQVGDLLDRGDHEVELLFWVERLAKEAAAHGGALHILNGNHEVMNVRGVFRYVTHGGLVDFQRWQLAQRISDSLKEKCDCGSDYRKALAAANMFKGDAHADARWTALQPGGPVTRRFLSRYPVVLQVGSTLFVHGGVLPQHVDYGLDRINQETQSWMLGQDESNGSKMPSFLSGRSAVVWSRAYSTEAHDRCDCDTLTKALGMIPGAERMVVGHTIQGSGINAACDGQVLRIDVGMSKGCGGNEPEVLEILDDKVVRRLQEPGAAARAAEAAVAAAAAQQAQPPAPSPQPVQG